MRLLLNKHQLQLELFINCSFTKKVREIHHRLKVLWELSHKLSFTIRTFLVHWKIKSILLIIILIEIYQLGCNKGILLLNNQGLGFKVLQFNNSNKELILVEIHLNNMSNNMNNLSNFLISLVVNVV